MEPCRVISRWVQQKHSRLWRRADGKRRQNPEASRECTRKLSLWSGQIKSEQTGDAVIDIYKRIWPRTRQSTSCPEKKKLKPKCKSLQLLYDRFYPNSTSCISALIISHLTWRYRYKRDFQIILRRNLNKLSVTEKLSKVTFTTRLSSVTTLGITMATNALMHIVKFIKREHKACKRLLITLAHILFVEYCSIHLKSNEIGHKTWEK